MQWLVKLVSSPGDLILDPFSGSGSTLVACVREGMHFIGIDQDEQYCEIARRRVVHEQRRTHVATRRGGHDSDPPPATGSIPPPAPTVEQPQQLGLPLALPPA